MKRILFAFLLVLSLFTIAAFAEEMTGIVTCEKCRHTDEKAASCAKTCVKSGVPAAFITTDGKFYKVANQDKVKEHVGHKVIVTGEVEGDTLTVDTLKMAPKGKAKTT